ncbi:MAG: hypothetical protein IT260_23085 [Saprospiraceae bacterium]|nr:hypothetical protein [Saprospiraceae bacterium]
MTRTKPLFTAILQGAFWLSAILLGNQCLDVVVPDISAEQVVLVAPADSLVTTGRTHTFFWETMADAESYNLRIVRPSFDSVVAVVLDTTISAHQFVFTLPFGVYEWNVVASNSAYASACCNTFRLLIRNDSSSNLSDQTVVLTAPTQQFATRETAVDFSWQALAGAEKYRFQVGTAGFGTLLVDKEMSATSTAATLATDGDYFWRVRAINESSLTMTAWTTRSFSLDRVPPPAPALVFPVDGDTLTLKAQSPDAYWTRATGVLRDTLFVYNNQQKDILLLQQALDLPETNWDGTVIDGLPEDFFWQVLSVDKAGNASAKSALRRFYIQ